MNINRSLLFKIIRWVLIVWLVWKVALIPVKIPITLMRFPEPQAIFILGGNFSRENFAAQFAQNKPEIDIWISHAPELKKQTAKIYRIFAESNIDRQKVHIDYEATDTVSNFTSLLDDFRQENIHHLYLITSASHMARARLIGTIIFGSNNIILTPIAVNDGGKPEPAIKLVRDLLRSIIYLLTGFTFSPPELR
jgi:uncharacterized SAM-binding protein YcdF (DUF218 family)